MIVWMIVEPARGTGSRWATGVNLPVRPTYPSMARTTVVAWRAGVMQGRRDVAGAPLDEQRLEARHGPRQPGQGVAADVVDGAGPARAFERSRADRLPELFALKGRPLDRRIPVLVASLVTVPAHFTTPTGKDHWHVLLRARAIENQLYVVAAAQIGETLPGKPAYGRSLIADPWGVVVAQAPDEETVIAAELDRAHLQNIRAKLPSLANRQPNAYRWPTRV